MRTDATSDLGGRLALLDPGGLDGGRKALFDEITSTMVGWADDAGFKSRTGDGRLIGPFNVVLYSPEMGRSFIALQAVEAKHTSLSERVRQVVILTVGSVWRSAYELYAHSAVSAKCGLSLSTIAALVRSEPSPELSSEELVAQAFVRQLSAAHAVETDVYRQALAAFGEKGLVDMVILAGCYQTVCSLLNAFDVPAPQDGERS